MDLGRYVEHDGRPAVRFVRRYPHPIDDVWAAVTEPDQLAQWFPSSIRLEPRVGGAITFFGDPYADDATGTVLAFDPPRHLAFSWRDDALYFDLETVDEAGCQLTLTNVLSERDTAARNASGWAICLGELEKLVAGASTSGAHSAANMAQFGSIYDAHVSAGLPAGAEVPAPKD